MNSPKNTPSPIVPANESEAGDDLAVSLLKSSALRLVCWLIALMTLGRRGHRWRLVRVNPGKVIQLIHLHGLAGIDADCTRCGLEWRDATCLGHSPRGCSSEILVIEGEVYAYSHDGPTSYEFDADKS